MNFASPNPSPADRLPIPLASLPQPIYLVGGSIRDLLMGRRVQGKQDFDLVTEQDPVLWGQQLARDLKVGFVVLDAERRIVRLVFKTMTLDIALQMGSSLAADLGRRDFACNAIAVELHHNHWVDPYNGRHDIEQRQIRMVDPQNLTEDPLRLLRAYRQAAQLGFEIEPATRVAIQQRGALLQQVAAERVRAELDGLLLTGSPGLAQLADAHQDGILSHWLPLSLQIEAAQQVHDWGIPLQASYPRCWATIQTALADQRPLQLMVLWGALLKGALASISAGVEVLHQLRYSRAEQQTLSRLLEGLAPFQAVEDAAFTEDALGMYRLFQKVGSLLPGLVLLALATGSRWEVVRGWLERYEDPQDPLAHPVPLLDGRILMQALQLSPGPAVGQILTQVGEAQAQGLIHTSAEALDYARQQMGSLSNFSQGEAKPH